MDREPTIAHFTAAVTPEDGWYVARCLEVEVASQGESIEQALANLKEALELYFEDTPVVDLPHPIVASVEISAPA
jgi:predicted RNase H-like HicB family nuclease